MFNTLIRERTAFAAIPKVNANVTSAANTTTATLDMKLFNRAECIVVVGTINGNLTVSFEESQYANGASAVQIANSTLTAITSANQVATIELNQSQMTDGYRYLRASANSSSANGTLTTMLLVGHDAKYEPAYDYDNGNVTQRLAVGV